MIPIYIPWVATNQVKYVNECLDKNELTFHGSFVKRFENAISSLVNGQECIAVSNGSVSLFAILKNLPGNVLPHKKFVITSSLTYAATVSQIILAGYVPVLVDSTPQLQIDEEALERTVRAYRYDIAAVMIPQLYADSPNMNKIQRLCKEASLFLIEDAAESFMCGNEQPCGTYGDAASFSFFANKVITCGEGGIITLKNKEIAEKIRLFINQGNIGGYKHNGPATNFRMTNLQAAIGVAQLEDYSTILEKKHYIADFYRKGLKCEPILPKVHYSAEWMPVFKLPEGKKYPDLLKFCLSKGFDCRPIFYPIHLLDGFKKCVIVAWEMSCERLVDNYFILPCYPDLRMEQLEYIVEKVNKFLTN